MRLFRALDGALRRRAVWITAPAGAGKTCLVASYLETRGLSALWYNVDTRDADVANLFQFLSTAARLTAKRKKWALPVFTADSQFGPAAFAGGFFHALCEALPVPSVIVFDDYQEAESEVWDDVIRQALSTLPKGIAAIVVSRSEPPPAFARHLASGDLTMLGAKELRLTPREMTAIVRLQRPDLGKSELSAALPRILELADGWAAFLTLLLLNRGLGAIGPGAVEESAGQLFDYFATEVLGKIAAPQRAFLLKTSIVPTVTAELASELTKDRDAARVLAHFERQSFLIQRLGTSGEFRYHPLLRDFLVRRAEADLGAGAVRDLHRRAAEWFVRAERIEEAMQAYEASASIDEMVALILRVAPAYHAAGKGLTVATWIGKLPASRVDANGWLSYWDAVCHLGHAPSHARQRFEAAYTRFARENDAGGLYASSAGAMQAIVHEGMNFADLDPWIERLQSLHDSGPACPESLRPMAATGMLMASAFRGLDASQNRQRADHAMQLALASDDLGFRVMTGGFLSFFYISEDPKRAKAIVAMLRKAARTDGAPPLSQLTLLLAETLCAWTAGDNDGCIRLVRDALSIAGRSGVFVWNEYLYSLGAQAALGAEDLERAQEFLQPLREIAGRGTFANASYQSYSAWEAVLRGDIPRALQCAELSLNYIDTLGYPFARAVARLAYAQVLALSKQKDEALAVLDEGRGIAAKVEDSLVLHACDLVEADIRWDDDRPRAVACLKRAFAVARDYGYYNTYWMRASMMARLAVRALENDIEPDYVRMVVARRKLSPAGVPAQLDQWPWRYRIRALGPFQVTADEKATMNRGRPIALRGMPLRFLQAVVALGPRGVLDTRIEDALWPDAEGDAARRVFDTTLYRLRRQLGNADVIRLNDGRVSLDDRLCWIDRSSLESTIAEVDAQIGRRAPAAVLSNLVHRLLSLYRGPLLADEDAPWIRRAREDISAQFRGAVDRLSKALERAGRLDDAKALRKRAAKEMKSDTTGARAERVLS